MTARSLTEVVKLKGKVTSLLLNSSRDLVCNNMWCEHVSGPCVCRLERTLQTLDVTMLTTLELRGNGLIALPPSIGKLTSLSLLDLRDNSLPLTKPAVLDTLPMLNGEGTENGLHGNALYQALVRETGPPTGKGPTESSPKGN